MRADLALELGDEAGRAGRLLVRAGARSRAHRRPRRAREPAARPAASSRRPAPTSSPAWRWIRRAPSCTRCTPAIAQQEERFEEAHDAYAEALRRDPTLAAAWSNRATLWYEQGEIERAVEDLRTALELDDDPDIRANLELATAARMSN